MDFSNDDDDDDGHVAMHNIMIFKEKKNIFNGFRAIKITPYWKKLEAK